MVDGTVDQTARDKASEALHSVNNFRAVTEGALKLLESKIDVGHTETNSKIDRIESAIKWAGGLIISLVLTVLGWAVLQQINANEAQKKDMAQQIQLLQQQEAARVQSRNDIMSRLPPRASEAADASEGGR